MPLFASSSGVQINGGNFYDIAGNMNLQSAQPAIESESRRAIEFPSPLADVTGRLLSGPERWNRHMGAARVLPYDNSHRPRIMGSLGSRSAHHEDQHESTLPFNPPSQTSPFTHAHNPGHSHFNHRSPREAIHAVIEDHPTHYGSRRSPAGNHPVGPFPTELRGQTPLDSAVSVVDPPVFPWNNPPHEPRTRINGGTFISGNVNHLNGETGLQFLYRAAANDASHDSGERYPQPRCHPETRTEILADLRAWSCGNDLESQILWLHGPAGAGKSAIAQALCQKLEAEGRLGASFFFKRGHPSRGHAMKLFPTIAYRLAVDHPELKGVISRHIESDPSIVDKSLSIQLQKLIIESVRENAQRAPTRSFTIVIDGLDECEGQDIQQELLRSIGNAVHQSTLRVLIASRPEPHIKEVFSEPGFRFYRPMNIQQSFEDVRRFLQDEFARILREHHETMVDVASPWPSPEVIEHLVEKSSGYFIYASTVIKFIDDKYFRPTDRLDIIMGMADPDAEAGSGSPFGALDQLYTQILSDVPARILLLRILPVIAAGLHSRLGAPHIEQLLELRPGSVRLALRGLHSVASLPEDSDKGDFSIEFFSRITVHHASFLDFLCHPTRSGIFYVAGVQHRTELARKILKAYTHTHTDPSLNRNSGHVAWTFGQAALKIITSTHPSPDLVSLLRSLNLDFLLHNISMRGQFNYQEDMILDWLRKAQPLPEDLIQLWEDYRFTLQCHGSWSRMRKSVFFGVHQVSQNCMEILLQAPPHLMRIFSTYRAYFHPNSPARWDHSPFHIRLWADLSWDELTTALCPLRAVVGDDEGLRVMLIFILDPALLLELQPSSTWRDIDIVRSCLRILKKIYSKKLPSQFKSVWTHLLSSCPPCPDLLVELELASRDGRPTNDYNDCDRVTFPQPPSDLIKRFRYETGWEATNLW
ncbi:hypothetical protein DFH09DRAFT_1131551 [Mycena vulgaris]|nr:hypothetical protein DFH09DRAFT_1131551 [Mycena vulgaris]